MGAIPAVATTRGLRSSAFDRHEEAMKKLLLPKDLAARAERLAPEKVEAEVKRIVTSKPKLVPDSLREYLRGMQQAQLQGIGQPWAGAIEPGQIVPIQQPWDLFAQQEALRREAEEQKRQAERERRRRNSMIGGLFAGGMF